MTPSLRNLITMITVFQFLDLSALANRVNTPDLPLTHCYHWLNERTQKFLAFKYSYAEKNNGELTFFTTGGNGAVAGPGLYCAKTPIGSLGYGDRVIRIEFVDDVVFGDGSSKICGTNGHFYPNSADCDSKPLDVHLYNTSNDWYLIKNPQVIKSWSANSPQLISEMNAIKADGDSAAASHLDTTLQIMAQDGPNIKNRTIFNGQARMGIDKILKDPVQLAKVPTLTLISMIASAGPGVLSDREKAALYVTHFDRAIRDMLLSYDDFENTLQQNTELKEVFQSRISKLDFSNAENFNTTVLIRAIDAFDIKISAEKVDKLWQAALVSAASLESLTGNKLKTNSPFRKRFAQALPPAAQLFSSVKDHNLVFLLVLLNDLVGKDANLAAYTKGLLEKNLKSNQADNLMAVYLKIDNPGMEKEKALAELITGSSRSNFSGLNPLTTGLLLDQVRGQFSKQQLVSMEKDLMALPLKVNSRLSYLFVDDLKDGKLKLPSFYSPEQFLLKLTDRAINERYLGNATTNTFRMIVSGYFLYYLKVANAERDPAEKAKVFKRASDFFMRFAQSMAGDKTSTYAYIAFQNGATFDAGLKVGEHPLEKALSNVGQDTQADQLMESVVSTSMDPSVLMYLLDASQQKNGKVSMHAGRLLQSMLKYVTSPAFAQFLSSSEVKYFQIERKAWANVVNNQKYSANGHVFSDLCSFSTAVTKVHAGLAANYGDVVPRLDAVMAKIQRDYCKGK